MIPYQLPASLYGLLETYSITSKLGTTVLGSLDKLTRDTAVAELVERGLPANTAEGVVADVTAPDTDRIRKQLDTTERDTLGLAEIDRLLALSEGPPPRWVVFTPRTVRGIDYYTGPIFEVEARRLSRLDRLR